jgi:flagellar assembly protein FliH
MGRSSATSWLPDRGGHHLIQAAEQEADQILLSARDLAQKVEEDARQDGWRKGEQEARSEMQRRLGLLEGLLKEACSQLAVLRQTIIRSAEEELLDLAVAIAERVVRTELAARREAVLPIVRTALEVARGRKVLAVRVNPKDYEVLAEHKGEVLASLEGARVVPDAEIAAGGCIVEVDSGLVDARIESQLSEAARLLGREELP